MSTNSFDPTTAGFIAKIVESLPRKGLTRKVMKKLETEGKLREFLSVLVQSELFHEVYNLIQTKGEYIFVNRKQRASFLEFKRPIYDCYGRGPISTYTLDMWHRHHIPTFDKRDKNVAEIIQNELSGITSPENWFGEFDLKAIQSKGPDFYREKIGERYVVCGWQSIVLDCDCDCKSIPIIFLDVIMLDVVEVKFTWVDIDSICFDGDHITYVHTKK